MKRFAPRKQLREWYQTTIMGNSQCCTSDSNSGDDKNSGPIAASVDDPPQERFAPGKQLREWYQNLVLGNSQRSAPESNNGENSVPSVAAAKPIPAGFTLLHGCVTMEEHEERIRTDLETVGFQCDKLERLWGQEGLRAIGFEFRFVPCSKHKCQSAGGEELHETNSEVQEDKRVRFDFSSKNNDEREGWHSCKDCATRLFHVGRQETDKELEVDSSTIENAVSIHQNGSNGNDSQNLDQAGVSKEENGSLAAANDSDATTCIRAQAEEGMNGEETTDSCENLPDIQDLDLEPKDRESGQNGDIHVNNKDQVDASVNLKASKVDQPPTKDDNYLTDTQQQKTAKPTTAQTPTPTPITSHNRSTYISDGLHYELLSTLAQEAAHELMCQTFNLEWVTICKDERHHEHLKALVDAHHPLLSEEKEAVEELLGIHTMSSHEDEKKELDECSSAAGDETEGNKSTLLIATGRGKVRAGIFSRFHLLTAGIEVGTAWHNIREARIRNMGVVIIDPNARGEQEGMETFKRSVIGLFTRAADRVKINTLHLHDTTKTQPPSSLDHPSSSIYILAHSASGGQLVRHLREDPSLLPTIRAIAFTDSTHNIQWCKDDPSLMEFLSTKNCIYLRSNDVRSSQSCIHVSSRGKDIACQCVNCKHNRKSAGVLADTDSFWEHRFGKIRTLWAGTADHALSNWAGHDHIWLHFDRHAVKDVK